MVGCVLDDIFVTLQVNVSLGVVMGMTMKIYETLSKKVTGVFVVEMMLRDILYSFMHLLIALSSVTPINPSPIIFYKQYLQCVP